MDVRSLRLLRRWVRKSEMAARLREMYADASRSFFVCKVYAKIVELSSLHFITIHAVGSR